MSAGALCDCPADNHVPSDKVKLGACNQYSMSQQGGKCEPCFLGWHRPCDEFAGPRDAMNGTRCTNCRWWKGHHRRQPDPPDPRRSHA